MTLIKGPLGQCGLGEVRGGGVPTWEWSVYGGGERKWGSEGYIRVSLLVGEGLGKAEEAGTLSMQRV